MKPSQKIIAVDIDEVLASFIDSFIVYHNRTFKTSVVKNNMFSFDLHEIFQSTKEEMDIRVDKYHKSGYVLKIKTVKGARSGIKSLKYKGYKLHLVTSRPIYLEEETRLWINKHFPGSFEGLHFAYNKYILDVSPKKKFEVCREIGATILIDDHIENALGCAENGIKVLLMDAPWNQTDSLPENIIRVKSWKEILDKIDKLWT